MVRYPALTLVPLAACVMLSLDGSLARAQDDYPTLARSPAATALLATEEGDDSQSYDRHDEDQATADNNPYDQPSDYGDSSYAESGADDSDQRGAPDSEVELIRERFPNGSIRIEREVTQDAEGNYINHGSWKQFDERGTLVSEGHYQRGERHGTWNRWYRSATECDLLQKLPHQQFAAPFISQAGFENGKLNGKWVIYDSKQRKITEWQFLGGNRDGKSVWYFANGHKMREIDYRDGEMEGPFNEWNAEGRQTVKENYQGGRRSAAKTDYYTNKQKKSEGMYLHSKEVVQTPDDWASAKVATYVKQGKDEKNGLWVQWYENGQKQMQGEYRNDLQVGKFSWWYANGQIALDGSYDNGKQTGKWIWWHQNGQKSTQGEYVDGTPTGRWRWWDTNGRVHETADLSHSEGKIVESPMPVPSKHKTEALLPQPAAPKVRKQLKR